MKEKGVIDELLKELKILEKKKAKILQEVEELGKKDPKAVKPEEIKSLVRRIVKLIDDFKEKIEATEKMASKL